MMSFLALGQDVSHQAISSYFLGPRAENLHEFRSNITALLDELQTAREQYFQEDVVRALSREQWPHMIPQTG